MKKYWHTFVVNRDIGVCCIRCGQRARIATNDCPGKHLDEIETMGVKEGLLDFREGTWVPESSNTYKRLTGKEHFRDFWSYMLALTVVILCALVILSTPELYLRVR